MATEKRRVAIVGGGIAGIAAIVSLKAEGIESVCFEAREATGGTWYYREESEVGYASVMPTTIFNNSKEFSAPSNFPPRKEYNIFMRQSEAHEYFLEYSRHFDCERYVRCNTEVISVRKSEDYDKTGRFLVTVKDKISGKVSTDTYDGVFVCTGHFSVPHMETFPGQEKFKGSIIHTHSLKGVEKYKGKNVLVIGNGCSGLDAADAASEVAKQVYLSSRSGMFVVSRLGPGGYPIDYILFRRYLNFCLKYLPRDLVSWYFETFYLDVKFDHRLYSKEPNYHVLNKDPILNDAIASKLLSGSVVLHGGVKYFTETGVVFEGEEEVTEVDAVIMATGYKWGFPFLEEGLLETEGGVINLYKCMYPTQLPHSSLVFIGFVNPFGSGIPLGEIQLRWAAHMFAGKGKLPSREVMLKDVAKRHRENMKHYTPSEYMSIRVDFMEYQEDIAAQLGVEPKLLKYLFTDLPLFLKLMFGPFLTYQFRLEGPGKWEGAREAIMTCNDRLFWPVTRENRRKKGFVQLIIEFVVNLVPRNVFLY